MNPNRTQTNPCTRNFLTALCAGALLLAGEHLASAVSTLPFYEPFTYGQGVQLGGTTSATVWDTGNSPSSSSSIVRTNAAIIYPAMPGGITTTNGLQSGSGTGKNRGATFTPQTNTSIYASFMFSVQTNPLSGRIFAALTDTTGTGPNARAAVFLDTAGRLHIAKTNTSYTTMDGASTYPLITSNTYLVVLRYKYNAGANDDQVALWLNPTGLGNNASEPPPTLVTTAGPDASASIQAFYHMAPSSPLNGTANFYMDELRVSTNWSDVTPTNGFDSTVYAMTGGGTNCPGSSFAVGLSGSTVGVNYILITNGVAAGTTPGTGAALPFGTYSTALSFNVLASNTVSSAVAWMNGTAIIAIPDAPGFSTQPVDYTVHTGGLAIYKTVTAGAIVTYQWRKNGTNLSNGGNISGANTDTLIISPAGGGDAALAASGYDLLIVDTCTTTNISTRVALTVNAAASLTWAGSATTNVAPWDIGLTASWSNGVATTTFFNGDSVLFDDSAVLGLPQRVVLSNANLNAASITVNAAGDYTFVAGTLVGPTTTLLKTGAGTLEFTNNAAGNTFGGGTTISNGTVMLRNYPVLGAGAVNLAGGTLVLVPAGSATSGLSNTVNVVANSTLQYNASGTFGGVVFGPITGTPGLTLTVNHAGAGPDRLRLYDEFTNSVNLDLTGAGIALAPYVSAGNQTYNGVISGPASIINRAGNGSIITLNGNNTYSGGTTITTGSIGLGINSTGPGGAVTSGPLGTGTLFPANEGTGAGGDAAIFASGGARTVGNAIVFQSTNTEFTLIIEGTNALNLSGPVTLAGTNRAFRVDNTNAATTISGPIGENVSGLGLLKTGPGTLYLNGTNTYTGLTTISNGALGGTGIIVGPVKVEFGELLMPGASIGTLTISNDLNIGGDLLIEINKAGPQTNDLVIVSGVLTNSGTGTVTVTNEGAALVGGNSFKLFNKPVQGGSALTIAPIPGAGLTWSNRLALDGSILVMSGAAPVSTNDFLSALVVTPAGALSPAFVSNVLSYAATEVYGNSSVTVTPTSADAGATIQVIYNGATNAVTSGSPSGPLALNASPLVSNPVTVRVTAADAVTAQNYLVTVTRQPAVNAPTLTRTSGGGNISLSWPLDHSGWSLQVQTNTRAIGLKTNWFDVAGSTTTNAVTLPVDPANPTVFYRLFHLAP